MSDKERSIAFALGGLAGSNAFGAGFLEAARILDVKPTIISCTSGQIHWVHQYLLCREHGTPLREVLAEEIAKVESTHNINLDMASVALWGRPGLFRPAYVEYATDILSNSFQAWQRIFKTSGNTFLLQEALQALPGRLLVPLLPDSYYAEISEGLNRSEVGIAFNSYSPMDGYEHVHLNERGRELLMQKSQRANAFAKNQASPYRERTIYDEITPDTVRDGLRLYQYGFDGHQSRFLDGAYYRQIMLSEVVCATDVFVVRPVSHAWLDESLPSSYIGIEDLKTEVAFNGAYASERHQICLINMLLARGDLPPGKYRHIDLHEIEIARQRGFLDYIFEKLEVFDDSFTRCTQELKSVLAQSD